MGSMAGSKGGVSEETREQVKDLRKPKSAEIAQPKEGVSPQKTKIKK
ncbi:MAG: hypothetical protein ACD_81C00143G0006 [uncultured bacterium]|uniref:Uncharacterized protein n=2 Tax=Candidatus Wolfeibacteriota TaxID=1752735 RepID=A0A0G1JGW0_9BACT|nr:MAG: hypothetical protein ACD_81C00143G0006 [uncultured bacterium]KKR12339.1 MAG: hypothetical protein UT41_C0002G0113 [Candidatus Wolfebacteria bacterium GW2011_GWC2_39_22]KKT43247.1 MAG: hypothetical protein UW32_C0002G0108 [Candidatus Wolfebacteria bacterium GW2011_GWE2_44_13]